MERNKRAEQAAAAYSQKISHDQMDEAAAVAPLAVEEDTNTDSESQPDTQNVDYDKFFEIPSWRPASSTNQKDKSVTSPKVQKKEKDRKSNDSGPSSSSASNAVLSFQQHPKEKVSFKNRILAKFSRGKKNNGEDIPLLTNEYGSNIRGGAGHAVNYGSFLNNTVMDAKNERTPLLNASVDAPKIHPTTTDKDEDKL